MSETILITGGCRSGRSSFAVALARRLGRPTLVLATCRPGDDEMRARIAAHRAGRPASWPVREEEYDVPGALRALAEPVVILDCVATWIANLLMRGDTDKAVLAAMSPLLSGIAACPARLVLAVTAEVGAGLVPETPLGRRFRDLLGIANQRLAADAARVFCMFAGLPVQIKPGSESIERIATGLAATLGESR